MVASTIVQPMTGDRPDVAHPPARTPAARWPRREDLLPLAYYLAVAGVLATTGTAAWRVGAVGLAAALQQLGFFAWRKPGLKHCVNTEPERAARGAVLRASSTFLVTTSLAIAVTGGVGSPLLVTLLAAYLAAVMIVGDGCETRWLLAGTALIAPILAALPRAWTGPGSPPGVHAALAALSVVGVGALLAPVHATRRKRLEELTRARSELASEALARAQTLEQIGSKVAHELKNPLTGVKALVQLGLRSPAETASHDRLEVVEREVTRMQEILQNYLSFTRPLQAVKPRRVDLGQLVSDTLEVLSARADDARVRLYAQGDAAIQADPRRLKEALLNLVANAIEATPPGGEVVVEVRAGADGAEVSVRDTGRGMGPDVLGRIGTPFFTTRDDGTGLGVVLARSVIAQHGGTLRYESEPGQGTRVRVTLPRGAMEGRDGACAARG